MGEVFHRIPTPVSSVVLAGLPGRSPDYSKQLALVRGKNVMVDYGFSRDMNVSHPGRSPGFQTPPSLHPYADAVAYHTVVLARNTASTMTFILTNSSALLLV